MKYLILTILILTSCSKKDKEDTIVNPVGPYENLPLIIKDIGKTKLTVLKGLPHQDHKVEFNKEKKKNIHVVRHGFHFYKEPILLDELVLKDITKLVKSKEPFSKWVGYKKCGEFHPDFSFIWKKGKNEVEFHLCFGCDEVKAYSKTRATYCELSSTEFKGLLKKYLDKEKSNKDSKKAEELLK